LANTSDQTTLIARSVLPAELFSQKKEIRMKIRFLRTIAIALVILAGVGFGVVAAAATKPAATVKTAQSGKFGTLLVSSTGLTLYQLGSEKAGTITCTGPCAKAWPPLLLAAGAKPIAGTGVSQALLGMIKRPDHGTQVTFGGKALYRFASDGKPGAVTGQNVAGFRVVVLKASSASATPPAATTTTSSGYSYGSG
jgi:predicted lipoprotein with Yx(FWY)xxD motif